MDDNNGQCRTGGKKKKVEYLDFKHPYIRHDSIGVLKDWQHKQCCIDLFDAILERDDTKLKYTSPSFKLCYWDGALKLHYASKRIIAIIDKQHREVTLSFRGGVEDEAKVRHMVRQYFIGKHFKFNLVNYEDMNDVLKGKREQGVYGNNGNIHTVFQSKRL